MSATFTTTIMKDADINATGIVVPPEVMAALGAKTKQPRVNVTLNGYTYQTTVAVRGGQSMLSLSQANRSAAGVKPGDTLDVTLALDLAPQTLDLPDDLKAALAANPGATQAFDALAFSKRKEFVRQVVEAKAQETRDRRIAGIITKLGGA